MAELGSQEKALMQKMATPSRFATYTSKSFTGYQWRAAPHLLYMEQRMMEAIYDTSRQSFIRVNMPPRHGKSQFCSLFLPGWVLGMFPERRIILVTYSDEFSAQWGGRVRNLLKLYGKELFSHTVDRNSSATSNWSMESTFGGMLSVGIGGGIAGQGGDIVIMDDVIKNAEEAASPTTKKKHYEEYVSNIRARLEPGGTMINVQTRWAEDDLSGMIEASSGEDSDVWEKIVFPAICEPPDDYEGEEEDFVDIIGRRPGEPLWPQRWTLDALHRIRSLNETTPATWDSLYQQRPVPRGGNMFPAEAWQFFKSHEINDVRARCHSLIRMWDLASSQDAGDWTVGLLMGVDHRNNFYVLDVQRFRKHPAGIEAAVIATAQQDGVRVRIRFEQERSGAGTIIVSNYKRVLPQYDVDGRRPIGTKESRAGVYASKVSNNMIFVPSDAPWTKDFIEEHRRFPRGRNDDQVDTGVYAYDELAALNGGSQIWTPASLMGLVRNEEYVPSLIQKGILSRT